MKRLLVALSLIATACGTSTSATTARTPTTVTTSTLSATAPSTTVHIDDEVSVEREIAFTDELAMSVYRPDDDATYPTVVFFHGGSWYGGDPANVEPYARTLASTGLVVFNATYRVGNFGGGFPQSYEDVACAIATASDLATEYRGSSDVVVAGHSAGAHLAATVVLAGDRFACPDLPAPKVAGFVGLSGPYESQRFGPLLAQWFGTAFPDDPAPWLEGYPYSYLDSADRIRVLLIHGDRDQLVPLGFSEDFATSLEDAGFPAVFEIVAGADHPDVIDPTLNGLATAELVKAFADG